MRGFEAPKDWADEGKTRRFAPDAQEIVRQGPGCSKIHSSNSITKSQIADDALGFGDG